MAQATPPNPWRLFSLGLELALATLVLGVVGWAIDGRIGTRPWGAIVGGLLGFVGGMYRFILQAREALRQGGGSSDSKGGA